MKRAFVFIDGGNFYFKLKDLTLGQVIRHPDKTYHEKGVDVRLAEKK